MYVKENLWQELPMGTAGFGRYELRKPERIMWETPMSVPMSTTGNDKAAWQRNLGGFGQPSTGEMATLGVASLVLWGLSVIFVGGVVIWVVRSIRRKD